MSDQPDGASAPTIQQTSAHFNKSTEAIVDRTGELLATASTFAEQYQKPTLMLLRDPAQGIEVPVTLDKNGVSAIPIGVFEDYRENPVRRTGTATMTRVDSFIDHVNRFKDADSAIFARDDRTSPKLTAVLDYHEAESGEFLEVRGEAGALPRFGQHRTSYAFPLSDEWEAWTGQNKKVMGMVEFAMFLEDRIVDVEQITDTEGLSAGIRQYIEATGTANIAGPTTLMGVATGLKINEASNVTNVVNLASGEGEIMFTSEHKDASGGKLVVPNLFIITIPVFANDAHYRLAARLRYRKKEGEIVFWFDLWRTDLVFDDAFTRSCEAVKAATGLPLFIGAPE